VESGQVKLLPGDEPDESDANQTRNPGNRVVYCRADPGLLPAPVDSSN
jgi:hypothetical protein